MFMKRFFFCYLIALLFIIVTSLSCSKCTKETTTTLSDLVPADVSSLVVFSDLSQTISEINKLIEKFSKGPLATFINQAQITFSKQLGLDVFDLEQWKKTGIDLKKKLAIVLDPSRPIVIVGIADQKAFETELKTRLKNLMAADKHSSATIEGVSINTISSSIGKEEVPRLYYAFHRGYALLTAGLVKPKVLADSIKLESSKRLTQAKWYGDILKNIDPKADFQFLVNGSQASERIMPISPQTGRLIRQGLGVGVAVSASGLSADCYWGLDQKNIKILNELGANIPNSHLEEYVPADTILAIKTRVNLPRLIELFFSLDPMAKQEYQQALSQAKEDIGVDIEAGTIHNLTGNAIVSLSLGQPEQINQLIASRGKGDASQAFALFSWVELSDPKKYSTLLTKVIEAAARYFPAGQSKVNSLEVITLAVEHELKTHLLSQGKYSGLCLGTDCPATASKLLDKKIPNLPTKLSAEAKKLFAQDSLLIAYANFSQFLEVIRKLDAAALGSHGMLVKLIIDLSTSVIENLQELTVIISPVSTGITIKGHVRIQ
jgi:hypothetical protein